MMLAGAVTRLVSAGMLAMMGRINLPAGLVVLSVAVALLGLGLVAKRCLGNLRLREIVSYHRRGALRPVHRGVHCGTAFLYGGRFDD